MSNQVLYIIMGAAGGIFAIILLAYLVLSKQMQKSEYRKIKKLQQGTKRETFSSEILYQKLYVTYVRTFFLKRYILKLRRKLEILYVEDEYATRRDAAKILTRVLLIFIPVVTATIIFTKSNLILLVAVLLFELFMIDMVIDGQVE